MNPQHQKAQDIKNNVASKDLVLENAGMATALLEGFQKESEAVSQLEATNQTWTLNHEASNLPDATEAMERLRSLTLSEVIALVQQGALGTANVDESQC